MFGTDILTPKQREVYDWLLSEHAQEEFDMHEGFSRRGCQTTCCIAGAAWWFAMGQPKTQGVIAWSCVSAIAMERLDLPHVPYWVRDTDFPIDIPAGWNRSRLTHPLFDYEIAPDPCPPEEAAEALLRAVQGLDPWPDGKRHSYNDKPWEDVE